MGGPNTTVDLGPGVRLLRGSKYYVTEHRKLYFNDANGTWIRFRGEDDHNSRCSSPLCVSLPSDSSIANPSLEPPDTSHVDMSSEDEAFEVQSDHEFEPGMHNYNEPGCKLW